VLPTRIQEEEKNITPEKGLEIEAFFFGINFKKQG